MLVLLKIRGISTFKYKSKKFFLITFYIPGLNQEVSDIYVCIKCKLHLVDGLKANMLIGNNVFYIEGFSIDFANVFAQIASYRINIIISARHYSKFLKCKVLANITPCILLKPKAFVFFQ